MKAAVTITVSCYTRRAPYIIFSIAPEHICRLQCTIFRVVFSVLRKDCFVDITYLLIVGTMQVNSRGCTYCAIDGSTVFM
jgi:hypothetical protein